LNQTNELIKDDLLYQVALTQVPNIGKIQARILSETFGEAKKVVNASASSLEHGESVAATRSSAVGSVGELARAQRDDRYS